MTRDSWTDRLARAGEKLLLAEANEIWMRIVLGFGLIMLTLWGFQAVCIAAREIARAGGIN